MKSLFAVYIFAWLVFAVFEVSFDREVFKAYTASKVSDDDPRENLPKLLPKAVTEYRVLQDQVISRTGDFVNKYEDCAIFDPDNWSCTYSDDSGTFGAKHGEYFNQSNLAKFPHLASLGTEETLSRFRFILLQCRWDATGGIDAVFCLFRPFMT